MYSRKFVELVIRKILEDVTISNNDRIYAIFTLLTTTFTTSSSLMTLYIRGCLAKYLHNFGSDRLLDSCLQPFRRGAALVWEIRMQMAKISKIEIKHAVLSILLLSGEKGEVHIRACDGCIYTRTSLFYQRGE